MVKLYGINSVKITSAEGMGFAIPIDTIKPIIQSFVEKDEFEEAYLGIFAYDKNVIPYLENNLELKNGIYVVQVNANSAASQFGLKEKDILLQIDGVELNKMSDLRSYIYTKKPKDKVEFVIMRDKKTINMPVILGEKKLDLIGDNSKQ